MAICMLQGLDRTGDRLTGLGIGLYRVERAP